MNHTHLLLARAAQKKGRRQCVLFDHKLNLGHLLDTLLDFRLGELAVPVCVELGHFPGRVGPDIAEVLVRVVAIEERAAVHTVLVVVG